jgi:hypothetical protein
LVTDLLPRPPLPVDDAPPADVDDAGDDVDDEGVLELLLLPHAAAANAITTAATAASDLLLS